MGGTTQEHAGSCILLILFLLLLFSTNYGLQIIESTLQIIEDSTIDEEKDLIQLSLKVLLAPPHFDGCTLALKFPNTSQLILTSFSLHPLSSVPWQPDRPEPEAEPRAV